MCTCAIEPKAGAQRPANASFRLEALRAPLESSTLISPLLWDQLPHDASNARALHLVSTYSLVQSVLVQHAGATGGAEPMCVVCLERRPTMAINPCGHRCLCVVDAPRFASATCPICRGPVRSILAIFDS